MNTDEMIKEIEKLIKKAGAAAMASDALHFSQAACNAANALSTAMHTLKTAKD